MSEIQTDKQLRERRLVFYTNDLTRIEKVLVEFIRLSGSKSVILVDKEGHMITRAGEVPSFDQDTISALVAGSFSATREMARLLGEQQFSALFHQGERDNIQLSIVGDRTILTVIFDDATTLGMVRLYVGQAVEKLEQLFQDIAAEHESGEVEKDELQQDFGDSARDTLDSLFSGGE